MPKQPNRPRRSTLSVPGSSPKMIAKAATLPVDQVLLDLEDAVAVDAKVDARATVIEALNQQPWAAPTVSLRIAVCSSRKHTWRARRRAGRRVPSVGDVCAGALRSAAVLVAAGGRG
mgnify:CR=1 FL=1